MHALHNDHGNGSYNLRSPCTPPNSPPIDSITIDFNYEDFLDNDLQNMDDLFDSISRIPSMDRLQQNFPLSNQDVVPALEVHSTMTSPYYILQFIGCMCLNITLCSNSLITTVGSSINNSTIFTFLVIRLINILCLGFFSYIFTSPDTFKSINITFSCLAINSVIYEYSLVSFMKYIAIHIVAGILSSLLAIGIYYDLIRDIPTDRLLENIFPSTITIHFGYSFVFVAILSHIALSTGITLITNMTTSMNARKQAINKSMFIFFINIIFGMISGPIGYLWPNLCLYGMLPILRNEFVELDKHLIIVYSTSILCVLLFYPFVAIQIKFVWRNKYRRYIEYGI